MFNFPSLYEILVAFPAFIIGLTFHEFAHGWAAYKLGDKTAYHQGRLTLNPIPHLDPVGFLMLVLFRFGWAKPVPVNPYNFRGDIKKGMLLVALAGPATNLLVALAASLLLGFTWVHMPFEREIYIQIMWQIIYINVILAIFNLLPVPPLDGSKILAGLLPGRQEWLYHLEQYGTIILLILLFTGLIGRVLGFFITPIINILTILVNLISVT